MYRQIIQWKDKNCIKAAKNCFCSICVNPERKFYAGKPEKRTFFFVTSTENKVYESIRLCIEILRFYEDMNHFMRPIVKTLMIYCRKNRIDTHIIDFWHYNWQQDFM